MQKADTFLLKTKPKGPQSHSSRLRKHTRATKYGEKLILDGKPEPGVMSHDRHESGVFTSSIAPNSEVGIPSQDSIAK